MKVFYVCEHCGKRYDNEKDATACEELHIEEELKKKAYEEERSAKHAEIDELYSKLMEKIEAYNKVYKDPRAIPLSAIFEKFFDL